MTPANIIEIPTTLGGLVPCMLEVGYEEGEIVVLTITPKGMLHGTGKPYTFTESDGQLYALLQSLVDQQWLEDAVNDKREQE